ncbi:hypothetical protein [Streptomyces sp. SYP-A7185]|uniref:hypothetical protein n=1 Tax=Streptomyces sp. SYP-A7185 TaxID=3040076 RepID=UPI0038F705F6
MTIEADIKIFTPGVRGLELVDCSLEWTLTSDEAQVKISHPDGTVYESRGANLWECLTEIRNECEPDGVRICCNGARRDCYPSSMAIQMGGGHKVTIREMGRQVTDMAAVVETFASADLEKVGTVAEQEAYYRAWLKSLPRPDEP